MAQNCNKIVAFDTNTLQRKSSLGRSASVAIHAALSATYRGVEALETRQAFTGSEVVYFSAALGKLREASRALQGMRDILVTGELSDEAAHWLKAFDYERLYQTGIAERRIPASHEQWSRMVSLTTSLNHLAVTDALLSDLADIEALIASAASSLQVGSALTPEQVRDLLAIQSSLLQFVAFAQMVAYMNVIEPLDPRWVRRSEVRDRALERQIG
ncbi:MAG: hypothetical protein KC432_09590 [Thermomicrobiales bacterium]|nr:hypothetical protein [Thermomicrobiales bacterium]